MLAKEILQAAKEGDKITLSHILPGAIPEDFQYEEKILFREVHEQYENRKNI